MRFITLFILAFNVGCDSTSKETGRPAETLPDEDGDGIDSSQDCDDADSNLGAVSEDADCDGVQTVEDCDDENPESTTLATDADTTTTPTREAPCT
jgi:hypothetical protein